MSNLTQFVPGFKRSKLAQPKPRPDATLSNTQVEQAFSELTKTNPDTFALSNMAWHLSDFASHVIRSSPRLTANELSEIVRKVEDVYVAAMAVDDLLNRMELGKRK